MTLIALACAGACAIPLALPLLAGAGLLTAGATLAKPSLEAIACGALALVAVGLLVLSRFRPAGRCNRGEGASCGVDGTCGCRQGPPTGA
jgi:mercuric ion transport protein